MQPLDDYPIGLGPDPAQQPTGRRFNAWTLGAVVLLIAAAVAAFLVVRRPNASDAGGTGSTAAAADKGASAARRPLGPDVEPRELPPLDLTDPLVRELLGALSVRPELTAWLATDGLVRNFVAGVDSVANGATPSAQLRALAPARPFTAEPRGDRFVIAARSYQRYDGVAETAAALDANGLARAYSTLRPRLEEAYRDLGYPDGRLDAAMERAIKRLLDTPLVEGPIEVAPAPVLYQFVDPRIEGLSSAQKQLVRMGPRNQRIIQDKLREVAGALGIPAS
jgi:Protein of unknown function (DUF3014)